ncbi:hypothetical protein U9M48_028911 [Paspalum notatum var. saurae]|uniref:Reverse transcriptase domain-containing protein n=1 Tax=Paspalum notatum var. saurae TaxID=547442 RepID=A0AAQ3U220_PASNO
MPRRSRRVAGLDPNPQNQQSWRLRNGWSEALGSLLKMRRSQTRVNLKGKRRFHFESFWPKIEGFLDVMQQNWNTPPVSTCPVERLFLKLQRSSKGLQKWSHRKKKKNFISRLQVGDRICTEQGEKQEAAFDLFENLIGTAHAREFSLDLASFHSPRHDLAALDETFSEVKVFATIKNFPPDKAPGPDGFTGRFYKFCWNIIKGDMMDAILAIQRGHVFKLRLLNTAFITLVAKTSDALQVKDYRPISLVHSFAKLVTKVMANRLAPLLPKLVSANQSAFVKSRNI